MKKYRGLRLLAICIGLYLIPCIITLFIRKNIPETDIKTFDSGIYVYVSNGSSVQELDLDEYLLGVVAASMPANYPLEALKAQAVISRTYMMNIIGERKSVEASELNQAWYSDAVMREKYGKDYAAFYKNLSEAAVDTTEEVLTYEEKPITPVYFRCSNGRTRSCADVWGSSIPYLVSVESSADTQCDEYKSEVTLSVEECIRQLKMKYSDFEADAAGFKDTVQILEKDGAGYVTKIQMGNREFSGEDLRYALNLASASFEVRAKSKTITFDVTGVGHGVGLSQWGAKALAEEGKGYRDILSYYFPGTEIQ